MPLFIMRNLATNPTRLSVKQLKSLGITDATMRENKCEILPQIPLIAFCSTKDILSVQCNNKKQIFDFDNINTPWWPCQPLKSVPYNTQEGDIADGHL